MEKTLFDTAVETIRTRNQEAVDRLKAWCEINSGTFNQEGVEKVGLEVAGTLSRLADHVSFESLPAFEQVLDTGEVKPLRVSDALLAYKRPDAELKVLFSIHLDTVYGLEHSFQKTQQLTESRLRGPGVADAKGGLAVMLETIGAWESLVHTTPLAKRLGWTVILNPDEEIGSPASSAFLQQQASSHDFGLVYEPALPDGGMILGRKGSGNYSLVVRGRSAHAGRELWNGRNAISALTRAMHQIESLQSSDYSVSVNVGKIHGGVSYNVVPDLAIGRFNVRVQRRDDMARIDRQLRSICSAICVDGVTAELTGSFLSPPKPVTADQQQLMNRITEAAASRGIHFEVRESGGVCDGNKLFDAGLPNIDTMGPVGGGIHSENEYVDCESLASRAQMGLQVMWNFCQNPDEFPRRKDRCTPGE